MDRAGRHHPGGGRPPKAKPQSQVVTEAKGGNETPLEYMLRVMNDQTVDISRRDRMAIAAASFCHPRMADYQKGQKDRQAEAVEKAPMGTPWANDFDTVEIRLS